MMNGRSPEHLLVHGPVGVGKTLCIDHILDQLADEGVKTVMINCWKYNSRPSLLTEFLIQLGYPAPRKGRPTDELLTRLREWLDKNRSIAVAFDEFDKLDDRAEVVYDLHTLNEEAENQLGIVMISNQEPDRIQLEPRSRSRVSYRTLEFEPYTQQQLTAILEDRVGRAFKSGSVPDEVLRTVAERVAEGGGDCRQALSAVLRGGRRADRENASRLEEHHLPV